MHSLPGVSHLGRLSHMLRYWPGEGICAQLTWWWPACQWHFSPPHSIPNTADGTTRSQRMTKAAHGFPSTLPVSDNPSTQMLPQSVQPDVSIRDRHTWPPVPRWHGVDQSMHTPSLDDTLFAPFARFPAPNPLTLNIRVRPAPAWSSLFVRQLCLPTLCAPQ